MLVARSEAVEGSAVEEDDDDDDEEVVLVGDGSVGTALVGFGARKNASIDRTEASKSRIVWVEPRSHLEIDCLLLASPYRSSIVVATSQERRQILLSIG